MFSTSPGYLRRYPILHTTDLDLSRSVMGGHYCRHEVQPKGRTQFESHVNAVHVGNARITYVDCASPLSIRTLSSPHWNTIFMPEEGGCGFDARGLISTAHGGQGVYVGAATELKMDARPIRLLSIEFPRSLVSESVACRGIDRFITDIDLNSGPGAALRSLCRWTAGELDRPESSHGIFGADRHLAMTLFSLYMKCLAPEHPHKAEKSLGRMAFDELEAYIDSQLTEPLTTESLARMTGVSSRTIQLAFREFRNCTPSEFIRQRRLDKIHEILTSGDLPSTITALVMTYGFFHPGRFSRSYFERFGERPSDTMRGSKRFDLLRPPSND
ncbi:helix-turn-helix domain-containing protein [bacterium]|nr:helix-turn-helix domain-containing protein [bacterium]